MAWPTPARSNSTRPGVKTGKGKETIETHKLQILDPATGTGTFLYGVIGQIYQTFAGNKGMWGRAMCRKTCCRACMASSC